MAIDSVAIVLVEPQSPGNIGMVCRAMKNMGLSDLRIVKGCRIDHPDACKFAVSAKELLGTARRFESLEEALADVHFSVATTRRHGKYRQEIMEPDEMAARLRDSLGDGKGAIVFGREDSGLTTDEVALCRWQSTIPTGSDYGSLNLAQAVLIYSYELHRAFGQEAAVVDRLPAAGEEMTELYRHMESSLLRIGFLNPENPAHIMRSLRRIFDRAEIDSREVSILRGMLTQVEWAADNYEGKKKR